MGGARFELVRHGVETRLGSCYQQIPVRLMPPFNFDSEPAALLYLINLTAGLMDGDAHCLDIAAKKGARAVITGQSATRVHPALASFATQQWAVDVADDACIVVLPGPLIPYRGCRYFQRGRLELAPTARAVWGDIWLPGRYDRGELSERFQFERIIQDFEVRRAGKLVYRERFKWDGPWSGGDVDWFFGDQLCCASLFAGGSVPPELPAVVPGARRAVFPLDNGETCFRWCGHPAAVTSDLALVALSIAGRWSSATTSRPWLLDSGALAPNHWFSPVIPH